MKYVLIFLVSALFSFSVGTLVLNATGHDADSRSASPAPTVTKTVTVSPTPTRTKTPVETKSPTELTYGESLLYPEGLLVTVEAPKNYPKDPTIKMLKKSYKMFTVKVKNNTKKVYLNTKDWYVESGDGQFTNTEGNGMPTVPMGAGETLTFTVVFGYDSAETPSFSFATCPAYEICEAHTWS